MPAGTEADIAIVGGGTAGAVLAARLAAAGRDVLVIEAGPDYGPAGAGGWPADLLDAGSLPTSHDWGYRATNAGGGDLALDRARVLGGCSAHNGCSQNWGWRGDYDAWGRRAPGWSAADLAPAFGRARAAMRLRNYAPDEIQPFQAAFLEACAAAGHRLADDLDDLDGVAGAGCAPVNIADGVRWNTAFAYLDPVRDRLRILDRTEVERIVPEADGPTRIHARAPAGPIEIHAAETVLCGGAYGTPELLLRSGIGDRGVLERAGTAVRHDLPGVGRGLQDHPSIELELDGSAELAARLADFARHRWLPEEQAILKLASPGCDGPYDLHCFPWVEPDPAAPHAWKCVFPVALVTPRSRGAVEPGGASTTGTSATRTTSPRSPMASPRCSSSSPARPSRRSSDRPVPCRRSSTRARSRSSSASTTPTTGTRARAARWARTRRREPSWTTTPGSTACRRSASRTRRSSRPSRVGRPRCRRPSSASASPSSWRTGR